MKVHVSVVALVAGTLVGLWGMAGCAKSDLARSIQDEDSRRSAPAAVSAPLVQQNPSTTVGSADPLSALDTTLLALRQLDLDVAAIRNEAQQVNASLIQPPVAMRSDVALVLQDLASFPMQDRAVEINQKLNRAFGPAEGASELFLSGTKQFVRQACMDSPELAPPVITYLLTELATHADEKRALAAGRLAGEIASDTGFTLGMRRLIIKSFFEQAMPLRQSVSYVAALDAARDSNGLAWVASLHADEFVGRTAVSMLSEHQRITAPVLLQLRERHQGLLAAQTKVWQGMAAIATTQKYLTEQATGLIAARDALTRAGKDLGGAADALDKARVEFEGKIAKAQEEIGSLEKRLAKLTGELQAALAEARQYKDQLNKGVS